MGAVIALLIIGVLKKKYFIVFLIFGVLLLPFVIPNPIKDRFLITFPFLVQNSIKSRIYSVLTFVEPTRSSLWREAIAIVKDFPVFGCGLNTYSIVAPAYKRAAVEAGIYPHNSYLQMAAEMGIVGLSAFLWLIFRLFMSSLKNLKNIKDGLYSNVLIGLLAGLAGFLVHSFFDVNLYALQLVTLMWFIMGLIMAVQRIALEEQNA